MPKTPAGRRVGKAAENTFRTLFEEYDHIVQKVDGQDDFGEDYYVTFTDEHEVTSDTIKVQVKGGVSWRRGNGYAVRVGHHGETWMSTNIPVYVVVYDPDTKALHWANATEQLRRSGTFERPRSIGISPNATLSDATMASFVAQARQYVGRYRGRQAVFTHLGEMSGADFAPEDHVLHFVNGYDEDLVFWRRPGDYAATLLLSARDWEPTMVSLESLMRSTLPAELVELTQDDLELFTAEDLGLSRAELAWAVSCFLATSQSDRGGEEEIMAPEECEGCPRCTGEPDQHASIEVDVADKYVFSQILSRMRTEPDLLRRSIQALRTEAELAPDIVDELGPLESDARLIRQLDALGEGAISTMADLEWGTLRLAILYLIDRVVIGAPSLPLDEQVRIVWRVPEEAAADPLESRS